jgi:hypothetical protein
MNKKSYTTLHPLPMEEVIQFDKALLKCKEQE